MKSRLLPSVCFIMSLATACGGGSDSKPTPPLETLSQDQLAALHDPAQCPELTGQYVLKTSVPGATYTYMREKADLEFKKNAANVYELAGVTEIPILVDGGFHDFPVKQDGVARRYSASCISGSVVISGFRDGQRTEVLRLTKTSTGFIAVGKYKDELRTSEYVHATSTDPGTSVDDLRFDQLTGKLQVKVLKDIVFRTTYYKDTTFPLFGLIIAGGKDVTLGGGKTPGSFACILYGNTVIANGTKAPVGQTYFPMRKTSTGLVIGNQTEISAIDCGALGTNVSIEHSPYKWISGDARIGDVRNALQGWLEFTIEP